MEIDRIAPADAVEKLTALLAAREALEAVTPPSAESAPAPLERALNPDEPAAVRQPGTIEATEALLPGADSDFSHEAATVQTTWRAPMPPAEMPRAHNDTSLPTTPADQAGFATPDALLVPALLTGLRVEHAAGWAQLSTGSPWAVPPAGERRREPRGQREQPPDPPNEDAAKTRAHEPRHDEPTMAPDAVLDAAASDWCDALTRALRTALSARRVPQALLAAAEQWKRGRCVVLACSQRDAGLDCPAWAFVLWPRAQAQSADGRPPELALRGLRVEARLQWSSPPRAGAWTHARVVKEHHPRSGRQLVSLRDGPSSPDQRVACEVQLGPPLARALRACEVCVRIASAHRFWAALGSQWSVHVVVCAQPLLAPPVVDGAT